MKQTVLALIVAASAAASLAQTTPAQTPLKPAAPAATAHHAAAASSAVKLPPGVPLARGIVKTAFTLRYEDIKIGTGADAEPNKMYKVFYTGYLGSNGRPDDGHKFDSSADHPGPPIRDKDGKPVMGDDGKPKLGDPMPMSFPQGMGRLIPGFDQGFYGMKIGGKRRIFIPWQLAYGAKGRPGPDPEHPGIPPKADLIFDVELVDVVDLPTPPARPGMGQMPGGRPMPGMNPNNRPGMPPTPGKPVTVPPPATPGAAPATPGTAPATAPATPGTAPATPGNAPAPTTPPTAVPAPATPPASTTPTPSTPQTQAPPQQR
ncbi:MAG: FKBP-type peptidyl-prolyl cis-trans isomerase [Terracidiphilus sp.]